MTSIFFGWAQPISFRTSKQVILSSVPLINRPVIEQRSSNYVLPCLTSPSPTFKTSSAIITSYFLISSPLPYQKKTMIHPPICWLISPNVGSPNICGIFKPQIRMIPHVSSEVSESLTPRPAVRGRPLPAPKTPRSTSASPEPPAPAACASSGHQCMATTWDRLRRKECGAIGSTGAMGYKKKG